MLKNIMRWLLNPLMNEHGFIGAVAKAAGPVIGGATDLATSLLAPAPEMPSMKFSPQEQQILQQLMSVLGGQSGLQQKIQPALLQLLGLGPTGGLLSFGQQVATGLGSDDRELLDSLRARYQSAVTGEGEFSPGLERDIRKTRRIGSEAIRRQLGKNFLRSTAGGASLGRLNEAELIARDESRRANLSLLGNLFGQRQGQLSNLLGARSAGVGAMYQPFQLAQGFLNALQPQQSLREQQYAIEAVNRNIGQQNKAGLISGIGSALGGLSSGIGSLFKK
jgi:hypothetical protein